MGRNLSFLGLAIALIIGLHGFEAKAAEPLKEWTFLVFLNGHNDLDDFSDLNLNAMEQVGSSDQVNIVVQWASLRANTTKRLYVTKDTNPTRVTSPVVHNPGLVDMGKYQNLVEFVRWAKENYPAKHYFIDVWNHGTGWRKRFAYLKGDFGAKDISLDDRFHSQITTMELGLAMSEIATMLGQKVDIYGSDACLMAMAEVAGEMKDSVRVFIGSQEVEPGEGWPYEKFLGPLVANPMMTAEELAVVHAREYLAAYSGGVFGEQEVTMSAFNLENWEAYEKAMAAFSAELKAAPPAERAKMITAANNAQGYYVSDYRDLIGFLDNMATANITGVNAATISTLRSSAEALVLTNQVSDSYSASHGLSVWMPTSRYTYTAYESKYAPLAFNKATAWGDALKLMLTRTAGEGQTE